MIKSNHIVVDGIKIFYRTAGDLNSPLLVFFPAWGTKVGRTIPHIKIGKDELINTLSSKFYVIDIEHPGLVRSQSPSPSWTLKEYATFYHKLFNKLQINKFYLLGSSFGGGIASIYSILFSQDLIALFLTDSVVSKEYPVTEFVNKKRNIIIQVLKSKIVPSFIKKLAINNYMGTPISSITEDEIGRKLAMCKSFDTLSLDIRYEDIKVPTLVVWGKDDRYTHPIEYGRDIAKKISNSKLIEVNGAVEYIYQYSQDFLSILLDYINTLD